MARFETWAEVARLFFGAACVGVLLILLLTAEAKKIKEKEEALVAEPENEKVVAEAGDISPLSGFRTVWSKLRQFIRYSKDNTPEKAGKRKKREVASEDFYSFPIRENLEEEMSSSSGPVIDGLSSALLTSALDGGHKIRHLDEKIAMLSEDDFLVKSIVNRFCGQQTSVSYIMCLNAPENNKTLHNESETKPEPEPETKDKEKRARYEDAVLQHVDVMKNRLSPIQSSPLSGGFCTSTSEILFIVLITSCLNCGIFLFITFCKGVWQEIKVEDSDEVLHGDDALRKLEERARIWKEPRTV